MNTESHGIADDQVRSAFQRWKNLEEEKDRIADDLKELFAEQKAFGHDTKAMRAAFRLKVKMDEARPEDAEHEALVDTYLAALEAPRASRAYARENIEENRRSDGGLSILTKHEDIRTAPVTADGSLGDGDGATVAPNGTATSGMEVTAGETAPHSPSDDGAIAEVKGRARLANADGVEPPSSVQVETPSDEREEAGNLADGRRTAANTGGIDVDGGALRAKPLVTGEGAENTALPTKPKVSFRPNCLQPEMCRSGTRDHCYSCRKAMAQHEDAA